MVATNKRVDERRVWHFMAGRGGHEHTIGELKSRLAFTRWHRTGMQAARGRS